MKTIVNLFLLIGIAVLLGCTASSATSMLGLQDFGKSAKNDKQGSQEYDHAGMLDPSKANLKAPDTFKAEFSTTQGDFVIQVNREWSPNGADRFYNLVKIGYFENIVIFRAVKGFMFQFGIHDDPQVNAAWKNATINDDASLADVSNQPGFISFAKTGQPNSRSRQMFINLGDNARLDTMGFTPFGKVVSGMEVLQKINTEYGENNSRDQGLFEMSGNKYILGEYPKLDIIRSVTIAQ